MAVVSGGAPLISPWSRKPRCRPPSAGRLHRRHRGELCAVLGTSRAQSRAVGDRRLLRGAAKAARRAKTNIGKSDRIDSVEVYPFYRSPGWIIHLRKFLRPAKCRGRRTCNRRPDRNSETGGRIFENAIENRSVQISFLRGRRLLRKSLPNVRHHLIRDLSPRLAFQAVDPAVSHAIGKLLLLTPQDLLRKKTSESLT